MGVGFTSYTNYRTTDPAGQPVRKFPSIERKEEQSLKQRMTFAYECLSCHSLHVLTLCVPAHVTRLLVRTHVEDVRGGQAETCVKPVVLRDAGWPYELMEDN